MTDRCLQEAGRQTGHARIRGGRTLGHRPVPRPSLHRSPLGGDRPEPVGDGAPGRPSGARGLGPAWSGGRRAGHVGHAHARGTQGSPTRSRPPASGCSRRCWRRSTRPSATRSAGLTGKLLVGMMREPGATRWTCRLCDLGACGRPTGPLPARAGGAAAVRPFGCVRGKAAGHGRSLTPGVGDWYEWVPGGNGDPGRGMPCDVANGAGRLAPRRMRGATGKAPTPAAGRPVDPGEPCPWWPARCS